MIRDDFLTNSAYGFPRGAVRRITPKVLAVVHITGNAGNVGDNAAENERNYANRSGSNGPSAHYYLDRDGSGVHAINEKRYAAWSNGDLTSPKLSNAGVAYLARLRADGIHNANEGCYLEIECVGAATTALQITDAQVETLAHLISDAAIDTGLEITDTTVLPHAYINTVNRPHCPALNPPTFMARVIARAREITDMVPATITDETPKLITLNTGDPWYDVDGVTVLTKSLAPLGPRTSPYGTTTPPRRSMYATVGGKRRIVLVVPRTVAPIPEPDCVDEIAAAITADRAKARIVYT